MWKRLLRLWRHRWTDEADLARALPPAALDRLTERVRRSERSHTGQLRIHAEAGLPWRYLWDGSSPRERALTLFGKLGVWDTEANNGVLIYLLLAERAIEVVADRGLAQQVPQAHWQDLVRRLASQLREGQFEAGLDQALDEVSALLALHFPRDASLIQINELPDRPTQGD